MKAALPLMVAGSLVQGIGAMKSANYNAQADQANAINAERDGAAQAAQIRDQSRIAMGSQIGAQAESGFTPGTGTALASLRESAINSELDVLDVRRQAATRAAAYSAQAALAKQQGQNALLGSLFGAASAVAGYKADYANATKAAGYTGSGPAKGY